jgi:hypothetical protein
MFFPVIIYSQNPVLPIPEALPRPSSPRPVPCHARSRDCLEAGSVVSFRHSAMLSLVQERTLGSFFMPLFLRMASICSSSRPSPLRIVGSNSAIRSLLRTS